MVPRSRQQQYRESKAKAYQDPKKCSRMKEQNRNSMKRRHNDPVKGPIIKEKNRKVKESARADPIRSVKINEQRRKSKKNSRKANKNPTTIESSDWPPTIEEEIVKTCIREFRKETSSDALSEKTCGICGINDKDITQYNIDEIPNSRHLKHTDSVEAPKEYKHYGFILDAAGVDGEEVSCCKTCINSLSNDKLPALSVANGMMFGKCPDVLKNLTIVEKHLISAYRTSMSVVKFKEVAGTGTDQRGVKGNCITFPQNIESIAKELKAKSLPRNVNDLPDIIKIVYVGSKPPTKLQLQNVLHVRRNKVVSALKWLKQNHKQYANIPLDRKNIRALPKNGIPSTVWETLHHSNEEENEKSIESSYTSETIDDIVRESIDDNFRNTENDIIMESSGVIDVDVNSVTTTEQATAAATNLVANMSDANEHGLHKNKLKEHHPDSVTVVPHGPEPVSEYNNPDIWTGGYPWLFPYGLGAPEDDRRDKVSLERWIKFILQHHFDRFQQDHGLIFHVFNVLKKRDVCLHTAMSVRHHRFSETAEILNNLSSERLEEILTSLSKGKIDDPAVKLLLNQIHVVGSKIKGSGYARRIFRNEIQGLMINMGMPCFYLTLNPADVHSPIISFLSGKDINLDEELPQVPNARDRAKLVAENPAKCAKYFNIIFTAFLTCLLRFGNSGGGIL